MEEHVRVESSDAEQGEEEQPVGTFKFASVVHVFHYSEFLVLSEGCVMYD